MDRSLPISSLNKTDRDHLDITATKNQRYERNSKLKTFFSKFRTFSVITNIFFVITNIFFRNYEHFYFEITNNYVIKSFCFEKANRIFGIL